MAKHNRGGKTTPPPETPQPAPRNQQTPPRAGRQASAPRPARAGTAVLSGVGWRPLPLLLWGTAFFLLVALSAFSSIKWPAALLLAATILLALFYGKELPRRLNLPFWAVSLLVLMCFISTFYALAGKFALHEFLKVVLAYCVFLLAVLFPGKGEGRGLRFASILEAACAISAFLSLDLLSTRIFSGMFQALMEFLGNKDYVSLAGVEAGVRLTGIFVNPNLFAGCMGIGVLLSLGLVRATPAGWQRKLHLSCLFLCSLTFLLAFSMGASASILPAFLVYLLLEHREHRLPQLLVMLETLLLSLCASFPIFLTSFQDWQGVQLIPLLCAAAGAAGLCLLDAVLGRRAAGFLAKFSGAALWLTGGALALAGLFAVLSVTISGPARLEGGETLRRAAYPDPGSYTLALNASAPVQVTVESQNEQETMMHTSTVLYRGPAQEANFSVPEDSLVVYFNFRAEEAAELTNARLEGEGGGESLKLGYPLLPGFIANRLQGLLANENAIQRTVFFRDGLKLFLRSPLVGLGMGSFENALLGVQTFFYETKYVHNHYIQLLLETGLVGLTLFLCVLGSCGAGVWFSRRKEGCSPFTAALGGALVFMALHAMTEVVFSASQYLPLAFGVFALICVCCGDALPLPHRLGTEQAGRWCVRAICALLGVFLLLLSGNLMAARIAERSDGRFFQNMRTALLLDRYEWTDHMLSYVYNAPDQSDPAVLEQAFVYARRLEQVSSNTVPLYVGEFYLRTNRTADALRLLEQYVNYTASDVRAWNSAFALLMRYDEQGDSQAIRTGATRLFDLFRQWNQENMGSLTLSEQVGAYLQSILVSG